MSTRPTGTRPRPRTGPGAPGRSGGEQATRERFAQRATEARRGAWRRRLRWLAVLAAVVALGWVVGVSPLLAAGDAEVTGVDPADRAAVEQLALSEQGTPLARVDTDALSRRIEAEVPGVAHADVGRGWPQTLTVDVTSRVPALAVQADSGGLRLMDLEGVTFRTVPEAPDGVPVVAAEKGADVSADGVAAARSMLRAMPVDMRSGVRDIRVDRADQVSFTTGGTRVVWGDADEAGRKVELVAILLPDKAETLDVSAPETPVTRG